MGLKRFFLGFLFATAVWSCAALKFQYKYYGMELAQYQGKLKGPTPAEDADFEKCAKNNCVVMFRDAFYALKQDYLDDKQKLIGCQGTK